MDITLFLAGAFLLVFIIGKGLDRIRIPWVFSALLIGLALSAYNPFTDITSSEPFLFMAELGMYFLLFIVGFELDIESILKSSGFIIKTTALLISLETFFGMLIVHYLFDVSWLISLLIGSSFSTVGEAMLIPILDEFKLMRTKLGQTILSIGVLDDLVEIMTLVLATYLISKSAGYSGESIGTVIFIMLSLFGLAFILVKFKKYIVKFRYGGIESLFLFTIFFIFLFIGLGDFAESAALGSLLSGIALKAILPKKMLEIISSEIRTVAYGLFTPIFFLWVGMDTDVLYMVKYPLLILLIILMTNSTKILGSYIMGRNVLGWKKSIVLGISLSVKFSTSIVIIKLLFDRGLIQSDLYSILIGTTIAFKFIIPGLLSYLIPKWNIGSKRRAGS